MTELDEKIRKLYESALNGLLPERQAQRMIQQYDEEQILLEKRLEDLECLVQQDEIKQVDTSRFIALVKKYRDCEELTDTILYAFIDRIEVHEATGGRTVYRQQNIDIHFNRLIYENGSRELPKDYRFEAVPDREYGKFLRYEAVPHDPDALRELLRDESRKRELLAPGDFKAQTVRCSLPSSDAHSTRL